MTRFTSPATSPLRGDRSTCGTHRPSRQVLQGLAIPVVLWWFLRRFKNRPWEGEDVLPSVWAGRLLQEDQFAMAFGVCFCKKGTQSSGASTSWKPRATHISSVCFGFLGFQVGPVSATRETLQATT